MRARWASSAATTPDSPTAAGRWTTSPTSSFVPWRVPQTPPPSPTRHRTACSETTSRSTRCSRTWPRPSPGRSASTRCRRRKRQPLLGPGRAGPQEFTAFTDMLIAHRKISPLLLALPVLAAIAAAVALRGGDTGAPRSHTAAAAAIPFANAAPRTLTTPQLVARYRAEAAAKPRSAQAVDNLALAELQMAREDGDPTWYTRADALFAHALALAPNDFTALAGRGSLALSRHDFAGGLALGRRALAIDPSSPYAMGVVVDANVELGRYPAARTALERLLRQRPD